MSILGKWGQPPLLAHGTRMNTPGDNRLFLAVRLRWLDSPEGSDIEGSQWFEVTRVYDSSVYGPLLLL